MTDPRYNIERERSLPLFGRYRLDWSTKWLIAIGCGLGALAFLSSVLSIYGLWLPVALVALAFWFIFIFIPFEGFGGRSLLTWLYRRARHDMGEQEFLSERVSVGENLFGSDKNPQPRKFSKHLGRVEYIPYEVAKGVHVGVAHDFRDSTYTVGLSVKLGSLMTDSSAVRDGKITGFGAFLNRVAAGGFHRFAWRTQIIPGEKIDLGRDMEVLRRDHNLSSHDGHDPTRFVEEYESLLGSESSERLVTFFFTILDKGRAHRRARKLKGGFPELLVKEVDDLVSDLGLASVPNIIGLKSVRFLRYNEMLLETRMVLDPIFTVPVYRLSPSPKKKIVFRESVAWPQACSFKYADHAVVGETFHKGFTIDEFTREGVIATDFSWLLNHNLPMTVTAVYAFVPWMMAFDHAVRATNATGGVVEELQREGKEPTEAQMLEADEARKRQRELAESSAVEVKERVYIDLTGRSLDDLTEMAEELRSLATRNGMPIAGLNLRHEDGVSVLLPVGRGLTSSSTRSWLTSLRR